MFDIPNLRLINQQISGSKFTTAREIVGWMGAIQAQDLNMSKWAVGIRLPCSIQESIESALNKGEIIRTHVLRPTWHLVSRDDIYWMLELTAARIKATMRLTDKQLELTEIIFNKSNSILEKVLRDSVQLSREELAGYLVREGISVDLNRLSHLLMRAELEKIICSGSIKGNRQGYALLSDRVPEKRSLNREESLAELARRYFTSHGPATVKDFEWWSGLTAGESKHALELIKSDFISETRDNRTYWFIHDNTGPDHKPNPMYLLPAFDEYLISYKDRTASLPAGLQRNAVSINGIFYPVIIHNGKVIGTWKRSIVKEKAIVAPEFFNPPGRQLYKMVVKASVPYGEFLNKPVEIISVLSGQ
jgi:hypothetical protein